MLNLIKILAAAFVLLGFGAALMKMPDETGNSGGSGFSLFKDLPTEPKAPKKAKKRPSGVVAEHRPGLLVIAPWVGDVTTVKATARQQDACQVGDRYPACL